MLIKRVFLNFKDPAIVAYRLDSAIRFFIYVFIFWLPYSNAVVESCVILASVLWICKRSVAYFFKCREDARVSATFQGFIRAFKPQQSCLNGSIFFFLSICAISIAVSLNPARSLHSFITKTCEWFAIYFIVTESFTAKRHILIALGLFVFTATAIGIDSLVQFYITHTDIFNGNRILPGNGATAAFSTPNDLGGFLAITLPIFASLIVYNYPKKYMKWICFLLFLVIFWALGITFSRGSWISGILGVAICLIFVNRKLVPRLFIYMTLLLISLYFLLASDIITLPRMSAESIQKSVNWRSSLWLDSIELIKGKPFFGHGLNSFMSLFYESAKGIRGPNYYYPTYAHNCYIQMAFEIGLLGLLSFLWIIVEFFNNAIHQLQRAMGDAAQMKILLAGIFAGSFAFLMHCLVDTDLYTLRLSALFWFMIGFAVAICNVSGQLSAVNNKLS